MKLLVLNTYIPLLLLNLDLTHSRLAKKKTKKKDLTHSLSKVISSGPNQNARFSRQRRPFNLTKNQKANQTSLTLTSYQYSTQESRPKRNRFEQILTSPIQLLLPKTPLFCLVLFSLLFNNNCFRCKFVVGRLLKMDLGQLAPLCFSAKRA